MSDSKRPDDPFDFESFFDQPVDEDGKPIAKANPQQPDAPTRRPAAAPEPSVPDDRDGFDPDDPFADFAEMGDPATARASPPPRQPEPPRPRAPQSFDDALDDAMAPDAPDSDPFRGPADPAPMGRRGPAAMAAPSSAGGGPPGGRAYGEDPFPQQGDQLPSGRVDMKRLEDIFNQRDENEPIDDEEPPPRTGPRWFPIVVAIGGLAVFGGLIYFAYMQFAGEGGPSGTKPVAERAAPLIRADPGPTRIRPEKPGPAVPFTNIDVLNPQPAGAPATPERITAPPETPLPRPDATAATEVPKPPMPPAATGAAAQPRAPAPAVPASPPAIDVAAMPGRGGVQPVDLMPSRGAAPPATRPGPAAVEPAQPLPSRAPAAPAVTGVGGVRIQIASHFDQAKADKAVQDLQAKLAEPLGRHALSVETGQANGRTAYRVVVEGLASVAEAEQLCARIKSRGSDCIVRR